MKYAAYELEEAECQEDVTRWTTIPRPEGNQDLAALQEVL
jgi:hypothetical protein